MNTGLLAFTIVKPCRGMAVLRRRCSDCLDVPRLNPRDRISRDRLLERKAVLKRKDPSGGTTGRVKPYGRLGWMGARAEYSRWGGITAPTFISRSRLARRSKGGAIFLTLYSKVDARKSSRRRANDVVCGRFVRGHRRRGVVHRPAHGSVIGRRRFFGSRLA